MQQLNPADSKKRLNFVTNFLTRILVYNEWPWNIFCSNEAHFTLDGAVNSQNCRIWGSTRPFVVHECSLHSDYLCVWCGFTADFNFGPFFFEQNTSQGP